MKRLFLLPALCLSFILFSCGNDDSVADLDMDDLDENIDDDDSEAVATPTSAFDEFNSASVSVSFDGDEITITSTALPNHTTPYWSTNNSLYIEPVLATASQMSPGTIQEGSYSLTVSAAPAFAASPTETGLGAIGISVTGVPIYNGSEGAGDVSVGVASGMDWAGGHSGPTGYHYHLEARDAGETSPLTIDDSKLLGIMSDGFLIYGRREEDGSYPDDLDESGGHWGTTQHSDVPFYHYHIVNEPYLDQYYMLFGFVDLQGTPSNIL